MATKVLMNRMTSPLAEKSLNKPHLLTNTGRTRSASFLAMGIDEQPAQKKRRCTAPPRIRTAKKSVHFDLSQNTEISSSLSPLDDATIRTLWFSPQDLQQIRLREANVVKIHRFCDYYLHQMTGLLAVACGANPEEYTDLSSAQLFLAKSPARGFERDVMPCVRHRRKEVIVTFLKSQTALQGYSTQMGDKFTPEFQQQALSQHYIKLARPAVRLAQLIAQGDAMLASDC